MRFSDFIVEENVAIQAILDIVTIMAGEDGHSLPIHAIQQELSAQGIDIDTNALIDIVQTLPIVTNVEAGNPKDYSIVFFNSDSAMHNPGSSAEPGDGEASRDKVSDMAKKQINKDL